MNPDFDPGDRPVTRTFSKVLTPTPVSACARTIAYTYSREQIERLRDLLERRKGSVAKAMADALVGGMWSEIEYPYRAIFIAERLEKIPETIAAFDNPPPNDQFSVRLHDGSVLHGTDAVNYITTPPASSPAES